MGYVQAAAAILAVALSADSADKQRKAQHRSERAQENLRQEQRAANAADAARERRQQIREERVRRARVVQAAANTGVSDSSGELGALSALSTNLSSGIGTNLGKIQTAENMSIFAQQDANARGDIVDLQRDLQVTQSIFRMIDQVGSAMNWQMPASKTTPTATIPSNAQNAPGE